MTMTARDKRKSVTKKAKAKSPRRSYTIVIKIIPAKGVATIRTRGKTITLRNPEHGWEAGPQTRFEEAPGYLWPRSWARFYIKGVRP